MVGIKTTFLPGKDLFFTLRTQAALYKSYNVKSHRDFMADIIRKKTEKGGKGLEPDDYYNIFYHALLFENKTITKEEVEDLIDTWQIEGLRDQDDLDILMYEAFTNSGMYPRTAFEKLKKINGMSIEEAEIYLSQLNKQGDDTGESSKT